MSYSACIFDLDGTLLNTVPSIRYTANLMLQQLGLPSVTDDEICHFAGDGALVLIERCLRHCGGEAAVAQAESACNLYLELFKEHCLYQVQPYPGIPELLQKLKQQGIKLAVCSNKPQPRTEDNIRAFFGDDTFDFVMGARPDIPRKPAPDGPLYIAAHFGLTPQQCLYIGDTNTDMETGAAAKMDRCGATWGFRGRDELAAFNPEFLFDSPLDIATIFS